MRFQTYKTFVNEERHFSWLVEDLIPEGGWTLLVGPPGSGKSMLSIQLTDSIQEGSSFLGMKTKKGNCLYIQADATEGEWQEQIRNLAPNSSAWTGYEVPKGALDNARYVEDFKRIVWGIHSRFGGVQFDFIVFDCLRSLTARDINSPAIMQTIRTMQEICTFSEGEEKKLFKTFLLIHHPTKTRGVRGVSAGAGYGGLESDCSSMLTLAGTMLAREKGRIRKNKQIHLRRLENGAWVLNEDESNPGSASRSSGDMTLTPAELELMSKYPMLKGLR